MTAADEDNDEPRVCADCVRDVYLGADIAKTGIEAECSYCHVEGPTISLEELADAVEAAFETHFVRTSDQPDAFQSAMLSDRESTYHFERDGEPVLWAIAGAAVITEEIAQDIVDILSERHSDFEMATMGEECEFDPDSHYEQRGPNDIEVQLEWSDLERSLKSETRFFNKDAEALLARIFTGIESYRSRDDRTVIRSAGPGTDLAHFFRARVFHRDEQLEAAILRPDRELGPPPSAVAVAGRMNARGVSLFYGATEAEAARAEVRPPVGSRVLFGRFDLVRPLRLLDIEALRSVYVEGSVFDPAYMGRLELAKFLGSLSRRMTLPVLPDDEPAEYLVTQVIADYLAANRTLAIDGLLYPSVQFPGDHQNVVLFRHASRVAVHELPEGTEVSAHLQQMDEDGPSPDYWVSEKVPPPPDPEPEPAKIPRWQWPGQPWDPFAEPKDERDPALRLAFDTLQVYHVNAVLIDGHAYRVQRNRFESRTPKFAEPPPPPLDDDPIF